MRFSKIIMAISLILLTKQSFAQSDTLGSASLNGHQFVINEFVRDPFIYTSFNLLMGYGSSDGYNFPTLNIGDYELNIRSGELFFGSLHTSYSHKINDWSMAYINFGVTGRFGSEPASMLTQGLNSITGFSYGMKFKILHTKKSMLSTEFRMKNYSISFINVFRYLKDLIEQNTTADLTQNAHILAGQIGASYAYAHNSLWGVYGSAKYFFGDSIIQGESVNQLNLGLSFDLNLYARTKIPLGINIGASSSTVPEFTLAKKSSSTIYSIQVAYVGRKDLQIGINASWFDSPLEVEGIPVTQGLETNVRNLSMIMRYFF